MEGFIKNERQMHLNSSTGVRGVLFTDPSYYIDDQLDKFSTKFAEVQKIRRNKAYSKKEQVYENKRQINLEREYKKQENQENQTARKMHSIAQSQLLHAYGVKRDAHTNGLPLNPISNEIHHTPSGNKMRFIQAEIVAKHLARAQNLQLRSTCGYNPLNGQPAQDMMPRVPSGFERDYISMVVEQSDAYNMKTGWLQSQK